MIEEQKEWETKSYNLSKSFGRKCERENESALQEQEVGSLQGRLQVAEVRLQHVEAVLVEETTTHNRFASLRTVEGASSRSSMSWSLSSEERLIIVNSRHLSRPSLDTLSHRGVRLSTPANHFLDLSRTMRKNIKKIQKK